MSAGAFVQTLYATDSGAIHSIKVQPETVLANVGGVNAAPAGPATGQGSARVNGSRRSLGIIARRVRLKFTGAAPDGYLAGGTVTIPILTPAAFNSITKGATGTYLGADVKVLGKTPEYVN